MNSKPCRRWPRRLLWTLICLSSLLLLYYQWENWRGARELKAAHQLLVEHYGSDDLARFLPPPAPDEQNYFANPLIESWRDKGSPDHPKYGFPWQKLMPPDFKLASDFESDLQAWKAMRTRNGTLLSEEKSLAEHFRAEAPDADRLIHQLRDGLDRPHATYRPGITERMRHSKTNVKGWPYMPDLSIMDFTAALSYQLRCAVRIGDKERAVTLVLIMLRLVEASGAENENLVGCMMSFVGAGLVHSAMEDTLGSGIWDEDTLRRVSRQLARRDDIQQFRETLRLESLRIFAVMNLALEKWGRDFSLADWFHSCVGDKTATKQPFFTFMVDHGPRGWQEAGLARSMRGVVEADTSLFSADVRPLEKTAGFPWHDPGSQFAVTRYVISAVSSFGTSAAITHTYHRCVQVAMALEQHRVRTGDYPASLAGLSDELRAIDYSDPFQNEQDLIYLRENGGFSIRSAGPDRSLGNDDDIDVKIETKPLMPKSMQAKAP